MKKIVILLSCLFFIWSINAQVMTVVGKVTAFQQHPFKNIVVSAQKSKAKVLTDENGEFSIFCLPGDVLVFQSKSCEKIKRKVTNPNDSIKVNLVFKSQRKSKEYANGYSVIDESKLTYAISNLDNSANDYSSYANVYEIIKGRVAGVYVNSNNDVIIRGPGSNSNSSALLVVDGVVVNDLLFLETQDVKSIDILKDASATIYGARGANGVVLITTKLSR